MKKNIVYSIIVVVVYVILVIISMKISIEPNSSLQIIIQLIPGVTLLILGSRMWKTYKGFSGFLKIFVFLVIIPFLIMALIVIIFGITDVSFY